VSKLTFYCHFPSKDDLIRAFCSTGTRLDGLVRAALARHQAAQSEAGRRSHPLQPLAAALAEWLREPGFRGCAFINAVAELGGGLDEALALSAAHKRDMVAAIARLLDTRPEAQALAEAAALAVDGAIVRAQTGGAALDEALAGLQRLLAALQAAPAGLNRPRGAGVANARRPLPMLTPRAAPGPTGRLTLAQPPPACRSAPAAGRPFAAFFLFFTQGLPMKKRLALALLAGPWLLSACSSTQLINQWSDPRFSQQRCAMCWSTPRNPDIGMARDRARGGHQPRRTHPPRRPTRCSATPR
jgi:AcrR family transcriptional regulator